MWAQQTFYQGIESLVEEDVNESNQCKLGKQNIFDEYDLILYAIFVMNSTAFWWMRFTVLALSTSFCFVPIVVTLRHKLQNRLPMLYAVIIAICQSVMCLSALIFGICSVILSDDVEFQDHQPEKNSAIEILCQFQAALFHSSELTSSCLTALLAKIIFDALRNKDIHVYEFKARIACFVAPIILMSIMAGRHAFGLCYFSEDKLSNQYVYFNSGCSREGFQLYFYLMYITPSCLLGIVTLIFVILIGVKRRELQFNHSNSIDHQLALIVYNIPSYCFLIYLLNQVFAAIFPQSNTWIVLIHQIFFFMPAVTMATVLIYKKYYVKYTKSLSYGLDEQ